MLSMETARSLLMELLLAILIEVNDYDEKYQQNNFLTTHLKVVLPPSKWDEDKGF